MMEWKPTENGRYIEKMLAQRVYYYLDPLCAVPTFIRPTFPLHYQYKQKPTPKDYYPRPPFVPTVCQKIYDFR